MKKHVNEGMSSYLTEVVEKGIYEAKQDDSFVPFEHIAYGRKNIPAITVTLRETPYKSREEKFSMLDRDLCLCKLSQVLFSLNEVIA
jgi:hypothetical protein